MIKMPATPVRILDMGWNYAKSRTLTTAVELDIFTHIANGKNTVRQISDAANSSERSIGMLLNALVGLGLLTKDKMACYHLAPDSGKFLVRGKESFLGDMIMHTAKLNEAWTHLTECVRTGRPYAKVNQEEKAEEYFPELVKALFNMNWPAARYAAQYLKKKKMQLSDILDVAAGSAVWGIAFMQEFPSARLTVLDFPEVIKVAKGYINKFNLAQRCNYIEGDIRQSDFGKNKFDLIILGHICHSEGRRNTEILIKKSFAALKKGGAALIADFIPNDAKSAPLIPLLFGLNMLVNTEEGEVFAFSEYKNWLTENGFKSIEMLKRAPSASPLIIAVK